MTKDEFITKTKKENWPADYVNDCIESAETCEADGLTAKYEIFLPPPPSPSTYP